MADDTSTAEAPWQPTLKALVGSSTFNGLHPDVQYKQIADISAKMNPNWNKASPEQQDAFVKGALAKYATDGPSASQATPKPPEQPGMLQKLGHAAAESLPIAGSLFGGALGTPADVATGPGGTLAGAGLGYAAGSSMKRMFEGEQTSVAEMPLQSAGDIIEGAATEMGGQLTGAAAKGMAQPIGSFFDAVTGKTAVRSAAEELGAATTKAMEDFAANEAKLQEQAGKQFTQEVKQHQETMMPQARAEALERESGTSPEASKMRRAMPPEKIEADVGLPSEQTLQHYDDVFKNTLGPYNRGKDVLSSKRQALADEFGKEEIASDELRTLLAGEKETWKNFMSPSGKALYGEANGILNPAEEEEGGIEAGGNVPNKSPGAYNVPFTNEKGEAGYIRDGKFLTKDEALKTTEKVNKAKAEEVKDPTFMRLSALRSKAANLSGNGADMGFAVKLRNKIDQLTEAHGIEGLPEINRQDRWFHANFDPMLDRFRASGDPADFTKALFDEPVRFNYVASVANPTEKSTIRPLLADYINAYGGADKFFQSDAAKQIQPALAELYGKDSLFADPKGWIYANDVTAHFDQALKDSPNAAATYAMAEKNSFKAITDQYANDVTKEAIKATQAMGPQGEQMAQAIRGVQDPQAQAALAAKLVYKTDINQVMAAGLKQGDMVLKNFKIPGVPEYIRNKWAMFMLAGMLGAKSPYMQAVASMGAVMGSQEVMASGLKWALQNSAMDAEKFVANMAKPWEMKSIQGAANFISRGVLAHEMNKLDIKSTQPPVQPKAVPVPRTKAENVSLKASGSTKLSELSGAPIAAVMEAYNKARNEDMDPKTARTLLSIATAKAQDSGVAKLDPKTRIQLAEMLKEEPHLDDGESERADSRGLGA